MAGVRHHYVPRFLQAGFNSRPGAKVRHVWRFRKGERGPRELPVTHVSVQKHFYDAEERGAAISADAAITRAEGARLSGLVRRLRAGNGRIKGYDQAIAELLTHVHMRTKAASVAVAMPVSRLYERMRVLAQDGPRLASLLESLAQAQPGLAARLLAPRHPGIDERTILAEFAKHADGNALTFPTNGALPVVQLPWASIAGTRLAAAMVRGMIEVSERPLAQSRYEGCRFHVLEFPEGLLVQGDTPVVFQRRHDATFVPNLRSTEDFDYAFLPLSETKVLIAEKTSLPHSWEPLQHASIVCSHEHFIASAPSDELTSMIALIGTSLLVISDEEIDQLFAEAIQAAHSIDWLSPTNFADLQQILEMASLTIGAPGAGGQ